MQVPVGPAAMLRSAYVVRIGGLQAGNDYSRYRLMISRPYIGRLTLQIIGLVLCGVAILLDASGLLDGRLDEIRRRPQNLSAHQGVQIPGHGRNKF
jgi:hypothetical protein